MLILERTHRDSQGTRGVLYADGLTIAATLEPANCDGEYSHGLRAGRYDITISWSPKFRRVLPLIIAPGREGIRIHAGNTARDTSGCVLVGDYFCGSRLVNSRVALERVIDYINSHLFSQLIVYENVSF